MLTTFSVEQLHDVAFMFHIHYTPWQCHTRQRALLCLLVVSLLQMAGADWLCRAGAAAAATATGLPLVPGLLPMLDLLHLPDLAHLDVPAPLSHQGLGGRAQVFGGGGALHLQLDPLDVLHGVVGPLQELCRCLALSGGLLARRVGEGLVGLQLALVAHGGGAADDEDHDDEERGHHNDDQQVLLQEVHQAAQYKVLQPGDGGGEAAQQVGGSGGCGGMLLGGASGGEGGR